MRFGDIFAWHSSQQGTCTHHLFHHLVSSEMKQKENSQVDSLKLEVDPQLLWKCCFLLRASNRQKWQIQIFICCWKSTPNGRGYYTFFSKARHCMMYLKQVFVIIYNIHISLWHLAIFLNRTKLSHIPSILHFYLAKKLLPEAVFFIFMVYSYTKSN